MSAGNEALRRWNAEHGTQAQSEGWQLLEDGLRQDGATPRIELRKGFAPQRFAIDAEAWRFVVARARLGSALHARALALVDPVEAAIIGRTTGWHPGMK